MNLLEATVVEILSEPYQMYGYWWVKVLYECYGQNSETSLFFDSYTATKNIKIGYKFLA